MYGEKIRKKRKEMGLSQDQLADQLGISRQAVSKWEMDKSQPSMNNLQEVAKILEVKPSYFLEGKEEPLEKKKEEGPLAKAFWELLYGAIGFVFFLMYYFAIMEGLLHLEPDRMPWLILSIYMVFSVIAFPQAIKDLGNKLEDMDYYTFSKFILPLVYLLAPCIVVYSLFKGEK